MFIQVTAIVKYADPHTTCDIAAASTLCVTPENHAWKLLCLSLTVVNLFRFEAYKYTGGATLASQLTF